VPIPGVPKGLRRQVRDAFVLALRIDPKLANSRVIKTWIIWDGSAPIADPTEAQMPAIVVRMLGGPVRRLSTKRGPGMPMSHIDESTLTMLIDLYTAGTDEGDLADVADLVYLALSPQADGPRAEIDEKFREAGIKDYQLMREILPMSAESFAQTAIWGQGSYDLKLQFFS
jgi:hypothetical protein